MPSRSAVTCCSDRIFRSVPGTDLLGPAGTDFPDSRIDRDVGSIRRRPGQGRALTLLDGGRVRRERNRGGSGRLATTKQNQRDDGDVFHGVFRSSRPRGIQHAICDELTLVQLQVGGSLYARCFSTLPHVALKLRDVECDFLPTKPVNSCARAAEPRVRRAGSARAASGPAA